MRLDKLLAHKGYGSRKDVRKIVKSKRVLINDIVATDPSMILNLDSDTIQVDQDVITYQENVYYMLYKPAGYVCSNDTSHYPSVLELIDDSRTDLIMVGRLDVDTEGLLLITNDGQFSHNVAHGKKAIYKQYYVELAKAFNHDFISELEAGISLNDVPLKPAKVEMVNDTALLLSIAEGKYHQVKNMMIYCENEVSYLKRVKIGNLSLDDTLEKGQYLQLDETIFDAI